MQELEQALNNHEGCQLIGTLQLKRMAGVLGISIHIQDFMALPEVREVLNMGGQNNNVHRTRSSSRRHWSASMRRMQGRRQGRISRRRRSPASPTYALFLMSPTC